MSFFGGIKISIESKLDGWPIITIKKDGEEYKAPLSQDEKGNTVVFCQNMEQLKDFRNALNFAIRELDKIIEE